MLVHNGRVLHYNRRAGNHFGTIRNPGLIWTPKQISGQVLLLRQDGAKTYLVVHCTSKDPHIGALVLGDFAASARSPPQML